MQRKSGLYNILFRRLIEVRESCKKEIIPFPELFEKICRNFSITKQEAWEVLFLLNDLELIQIIAGHGIKILTT